jgi:hypothetical protein
LSQVVEQRLASPPCSTLGAAPPSVYWADDAHAQSCDWIPPDALMWQPPWGCVAHAIAAERHCASSAPVLPPPLHLQPPPPPLPPSPPQQPPPGPSSTHLTTLPVHNPATSRNTHRVDILDAASECQQKMRHHTQLVQVRGLFTLQPHPPLTLRRHLVSLPRCTCITITPASKVHVSRLLQACRCGMG